MPNIELYGYDRRPAARLEAKIRKAFKTYREPREIVITTISSSVRRLNGKRSAFLRVIASPGELEDVKMRLASFGEDIEVIPLGQWIPKRTS